MEPQTQHDDVRETARGEPAGQAAAPRRRRFHLTRHGVALLLRLSGSLVAGLAIAAALLVWRVTSGPLSLDFLTPWLQQALSDSEHGITIAIEHTELSHTPGGSTFELVAEGFHLRRTDGSAEVTLPRVALDLSMRAALSGQLAPTRIVLTAPQLRVTRAPDGTIHVGLGEGAGDEDIAGGVLADLEVKPNQRGPLGYLREIAIRNAQLTLDDRALGVTWQARRADATLYRGEDGLAGDAEVAVVAGGQEANLHADFRYFDAEHRLSGSLSIADLEPARFAAAAPVLALLEAVKVPITGRIGFSVNAENMHIEGARGDFTVGPGRIDEAHLMNGSLPVAGGTAKLAYDPAAGRVSIEEVTLDIGGPEISLAGRIDGVDAGFLRGGALKRLDVGGRVALRKLPVDALARYWPTWLSPSSRTWVTGHIHDGIAEETKADLHLVVDLDPTAAKPVQVDTLQGTVAYHNLMADYFPPLPPVSQIDGTGSFDRAHFDLLPTSGVLLGQRITSGKIQMTKLDTNDETIAIAIGVRGPLRDALQVIDTPPLRYAHALGVDPAKVAGTAETQLLFRFPLVHDLKFSSTDYSAKATLKDVAIPGLAYGYDLAAGDLKLELDRTQFRVQGTAQIDGIQSALAWTQSLKAGDATRRYGVKAKLDDAARRHLGVDFLSDFVRGPVDVDLTYTTQKGNGEASLGLDLKDATIAVDKLDWTKPAGSPATAQMKLVIAADQIIEIPEATLKGEGLDAALAAKFDPATGTIERADARRLMLGRTDVAGSIRRQPAGGWAVSMTGRSLDATKLVTKLGKSGAAERGPPLSLDIRLDRVILAPERELSYLALRFVDDGRHWETVVADALFTGGGTMSVRYGEIPGQRDLRISTDNLGATLKILDVSDNVVGGKVTVLGKSEDQGERRIFAGHVEGADYKVVHAPMFAQVLSVASLTAISSMLSGEGIPFSRIAGDYVFDAGKVTVTNARALGGAIGINISKGTLDLGADTLDLRGTLAPAYTINSLVSKIPLLGDIITGEDQAVFAANFRIRGPSSDPKVSVNPLGMIAPGFVRKLFLFDAPPPSDAPNSDSPYAAPPGGTDLK